MDNINQLDVKELAIKPEHQTLKVEHNSKLLDPGPKRLVSIGTSASGKTRWIITKFFPMLCDCFLVTLVCKNENQECYKALEDHCKKKDIPFEIGEELTNEMFEKIINGPKVPIDEKKGKFANLPSFTLIDDIAEKDQLKAVKKLFKFGRHSNCNVVAVAQNLTDIPKQIRGNFTNFLIHPVGSDFEANALLRYAGSVAPADALKRAYWDFIVKPENKYSCIFLSRDKPMNFIMDKDGHVTGLTETDLNTQEGGNIEPVKKKLKAPRTKKNDYEKMLMRIIKDGGSDNIHKYEK